MAQATTAPATSATTQMAFQLSGGYQFADTFNVIAQDPFVYAQAGRLTGAFMWRFADGTEARTHINGATANRVTAQGAQIFGTMKINMFEATGAAPDSELLYLAYEGAIKAEGTKVTVSVKGNFVGGTGRYKGATGQVDLNSINGFFTDGKGTLVLQGAQSIRPTSSASRHETVRAAVKRYFEGTRSMDAARWASAFASNAIVVDPISQPALTTPAQIRAQGDGFVSAFESVGLRERYVEINGDEAVAYWEGTGKQKDGKTVRFEGINHFRFDANGKIELLRGFWSPANMRIE